MSTVPASPFAPPSLEDYLAKYLRWPHEDPTLVDLDQFAEEVERPFEALVSAEKWVSEYYDAKNTAIEFFAESDPESVYVYEVDLGELNYVVIEEKEEIIVLSEKGAVSVPNTGIVQYALAAPPKEESQVKVVVVTRQGEVRPIDVQALAEAIAGLRGKAVDFTRATDAGRRLARVAPVRSALTPEQAARGLAAAGLARKEEVLEKFELSAGTLKPLAPQDPAVAEKPQVVVRPSELYLARRSEERYEETARTAPAGALRFWGELLGRMGRHVAATATGAYVFKDTMPAQVGYGEELFQVRRGLGTVIVRKPAPATPTPDPLLTAAMLDGDQEETDRWLDALAEKIAAGEPSRTATPSPRDVSASWVKAAEAPATPSSYWVEPEATLVAPEPDRAIEAEAEAWLQWMRMSAPVYTRATGGIPRASRTDLPRAVETDDLLRRGQAQRSGDAPPAALALGNDEAPRRPAAAETDDVPRAARPSPAGLRKLNLRDDQKARAERSEVGLEADGYFVTQVPPEPLGVRPVMPVGALKALLAGLEHSARFNPAVPPPRPMRFGTMEMDEVPRDVVAPLVGEAATLPRPPKRAGIPVAAWMVPGPAVQPEEAKKLDRARSVSQDLSRVLAALPFPDDARVEVGSELSAALDTLIASHVRAGPAMETDDLPRLTSVADVAELARLSGSFAPEAIRRALASARGTPVAAWELGPRAEEPPAEIVRRPAPELAESVPQGELVEAPRPEEFTSERVVRAFMRLPGALPIAAPKPALESKSPLLDQAVARANLNVTIEPKLELTVQKVEPPERPAPASPAVARAEEPGGMTAAALAPLAFPRLDPAAVAELLALAYGRTEISGDEATESAAAAARVPPIDLSPLVGALESLALAVRGSRVGEGEGATAVGPQMPSPSARALASELAATLPRPAALNFGFALERELKGMDLATAVAERMVDMPAREQAVHLAPLAAAELDPAGELVVGAPAEGATLGLPRPAVPRSAAPSASAGITLPATGASVRGTLDALLAYLREAGRRYSPGATPGEVTRVRVREVAWPVVMMMLYADQASNAPPTPRRAPRKNIGTHKWTLGGRDLALGAAPAGAAAAAPEGEFVASSNEPALVVEARPGTMVHAGTQPSAPSPIGNVPRPAAPPQSAPPSMLVQPPRPAPGSPIHLDMTVVKAPPPRPPPVLQANSPMVTPRLKRPGESPGVGAQSVEPPRGAQVGLQATVDAIAQRVYHRIMRKLESDQERSGGF